MLAHTISFRHWQIAKGSLGGLTNDAHCWRIEESFPKSGPVAQLGARFHGMEEVIGSIPIRSTKFFNNLDNGTLLGIVIVSSFVS